MPTFLHNSRDGPGCHGRGIKRGQTHGHTENLRLGDPGYLTDKLQLKSPPRVYFIQLNSETGLLYKLLQINKEPGLFYS